MKWNGNNTQKWNENNLILFYTYFCSFFFLLLFRFLYLYLVRPLLANNLKRRFAEFSADVRPWLTSLARISNWNWIGNKTVQEEESAEISSLAACH